MTLSTSSRASRRIIIAPESTWRAAAAKHHERIYNLLKPGLTSRDHPLNSGGRKKKANRRAKRQKRQQRHRAAFYDGDENTIGEAKKGEAVMGKEFPVNDDDGDYEQEEEEQFRWTALDPKNPIYNFLIEYYGIKGSSGPRRLARWSPDPALLLRGVDSNAPTMTGRQGLMDAAVAASRGAGGILLENAMESDIGGTLHLRGATWVGLSGGSSSSTSLNGERGAFGLLYSPALHYDRCNTHCGQKEEEEERTIQQRKIRAASPFQWYRTILSTVLTSDPILHCHGLHEWAMQYHPPGSSSPPSAKYQSHLPYRVSREIINQTVERKGVHCTHVDALRFFAPASEPYSRHGICIDRSQHQARLEQKGCVHAQMDLFKMALRLQPFVDATLIGDTLEVALEARRLDVAASPYDASAYGLKPVPVETERGRKQYRERQVELMEMAHPIRERLLRAYDVFLSEAFEDDVLDGKIK